MSITVGELTKIIEELYPPALAQDWDSVGLICGDPQEVVDTVMVALDPTYEVAIEAVEAGAQFLLTHHPLYLRGTDNVAATNAKGKTVHTLIRGGCALMNAHTNADAASGGVAEALAELAGLENTVPLEADSVHPELGIGRVGSLTEPVTLADFARNLAENLPASPGGLLVGGPLDATIQKIAVSGGAGDSLLGAARNAGADVFVTADLRHHPASEHLEEGKPYLLCGTHWATEWPWVPWAAAKLTEILAPYGNINVKTSKLVTEPWTAHYPTQKG